jgi:hypothetical protein
VTTEDVRRHNIRMKCAYFTHIYVDQPSKKRLRRSTVRLVEGSNCMHACMSNFAAAGGYQ